MKQTILYMLSLLTAGFISIGAEADTTLKMTVNEGAADIVINVAPYDTAKVSSLVLTWGDNSETIDFTRNQTTYNKSITAQDAHILNITGDLDNIAFLDVSGNEITSLSVNGLQGLHTLWCNDNLLTQLDLSNLPALQSLDCSNNSIANLPYDVLAQLNQLNCAYNTLTALDLNKMQNLLWLNCNGNAINALSTAYAPHLQRLYCEATNIPSLDVSNNKELRMLDFADTPITAVSLAGADSLREVYGNKSRIAQIDLATLKKLIFTDCSDTPLESATLNGPTSFVQIMLSRTNVKALDISNMTNVTELYANQSALETLAMLAQNMGTRYLYRLNVTQSQLKALNLIKYYSIYDLDISNCPLSALQLYNYAVIQHIDCRNDMLGFNNIPDYARAQLYAYAPQQYIQLPAAQTTLAVDLSAQDVLRWGQYNSTTGKRARPTYTWYYADGTEVPTSSYTISGGVTTFTNGFYADVYCVLNNPNFPDLKDDYALRTTTIKIGDPTAISSPERKESWNIYSTEGRIHVSGNGNATNVRLTTLDGRSHKFHFNGKYASYSVGKGIYVVSLDAGTATITKTISVK